ncbi:hypothetical protein HAZT_HAZT003738 [Hyalella azteca]|uniref:MYND-type domain-containing protein n=1 Tax=Hyalella azteca TaxID=294128 RepID=A0A6A0GXX5_HYAAZ|nr:hypothetical protein HAZT_HAZT003738 [Hyalella azteca]
MDACNYCGAPGALKCGRCHAACYCSRDHQRLDSGDHRDLCKNYTSVSSPDLGEHLAATCLILPGNLIFSENPILVGPVAYSDLICLGCHSAITEEDFSKCPDCKWPVCSKVCANSKSHWAECDVLAKDELGIGIPQHIGQTPRYDLIMLLRGLLLKETDPKSWKVLMAMQSHKEIWKKDNDPFHAAAVKYFTEVCKCGFDEDEIHHVRGLIDVLQEVSDWLNRIDMSDFIGKRTVKQLNKDVDRMHDSFHPLHYVPLQFTQNLLREIKGENYVTFKLRQEIWENHLEICDKLEPGLTRRRGRSKFLK